jgi:anti-sigma regulatory factor (Ser/Thr protein kinase)/anti-anti-sigma regulatory factor
MPQAHATTVCLAIFDPVDGRLDYCTAGHPPPLLVMSGGDTRYLPGTGGTPLGTGGTFPVRTERLELGDLVLLYSDGILERPGRTPAVSRDELARVAADSTAGRALHDPKASPAERVCTQTVELLVRATGHADDITMLAAQRVRPPADLDLWLPAELSSLRRSRVEIAAWLDAAGAGEQDTFLLQHALGELTTNAIEHADSDAGVSLHLTLTPAGAVEATVTDHGHWQEPSRQPLRGRGLALTAQLIDDLRVTPAGAGTVAVVRHALTRPARMLAGVVPARDRPPRPGGTLTITELPGDDETRVRVAGPLDATSADTLRQNLLRRSRGGTVTMTVDLTEVTHLASAGVSALHQVADHHHDESAPLRLQAAPGSVADQVLALVALPHTAPD